MVARGLTMGADEAAGDPHRRSFTDRGHAVMEAPPTGSWGAEGRPVRVTPRPGRPPQATASGRGSTMTTQGDQGDAPKQTFPTEERPLSRKAKKPKPRKVEKRQPRRR